MILATDASFISNALRSIFGLLDGLVYWLLVQIYNLFMTIASVDLFNDKVVGTFADRIYALLGVVVLFRLTISVFTYILDPDKMSDSKTGFGSLIKNVIVMLVILTLTPFIFDKAMALQRTVLKENTISKIIVGKTSASTKGFGDALAKDTLISFVEPSDVASAENEKALYDMIDDPNATYKDVLKLATDNKKKESGQYIYDYRYLVSTIVGGFMVYIFLIFSIDIAVRTVKLGFLKLIAPLPIVTYVDPKGRDLFNKWLKQCTSTYLDLFIRLAGIFFAQYLVTLIMNAETWKDMTTTTGENPNFLVKVFIILGCLMFAKQLPEILKGLGLNVGGKFELNPLKKISAGAVGGAAIAGGLGLAGRTLGNLGGAAWSATGGQAFGAIGGAIQNKYKGSGLETRIDKIKSGAGNGFGAIDNFSGNYLSRIGADFTGTVGFGARDDKRISQLGKITSAVGKMEERAVDKIKTGGAGSLSARYNKYVEQINYERNLGTQEGALEAARLTQEMNDWLYSNKSDGAASQYIDGVVNGQFNFIDKDKNSVTIAADFSDTTLKAALYEDYKAATAAAGIEAKKTASEMHDQMGAMKGEIGDRQRKKMAQRDAAKK